MEAEYACILSVGNEILIGKILNSNAQWIAQKLTLLGFTVRSIVTTRDDVLETAEAFKQAIRSKSRIIISTGGLGPTFDDKTAESLARALNLPLVLSEEAYKMILEKYRRASMNMTPEREKMAYIPLGAKPIYNPVGTAPGIYLKYRGSHIFVLPGPPKEMTAMFESEVLPILRKIAPKVFWGEFLLQVKGIPEADFAPTVKDAMKRFKKIYVKSHPRGKETGLSVIEVHVTSSGKNKGEILDELWGAFSFLTKSVKEMGGILEVKKEPTVYKL